MEKTKSKGALRTCQYGHQYYKSSDCPTCPKCESKKKPSEEWMSDLSAPARRALEGAGIKTLMQLSNWSEKEILHLHGVGKSSIPKLKTSLQMERLSFKE
jgi:hypothetical protein